MSEPWVTEVTAGSGLFGPALFDDYTRWVAGEQIVDEVPTYRGEGQCFL